MEHCHNENKKSVAKLFVSHFQIIRKNLLHLHCQVQILATLVDMVRCIFLALMRVHIPRIPTGLTHKS